MLTPIPWNSKDNSLPLTNGDEFCLCAFMKAKSKCVVVASTSIKFDPYGKNVNVFVFGLIYCNSFIFFFYINCGVRKKKRRGFLLLLLKRKRSSFSYLWSYYFHVWLFFFIKKHLNSFFFLFLNFRILFHFEFLMDFLSNYLLNKIDFNLKSSAYGSIDV